MKKINILLLFYALYVVFMMPDSNAQNSVTPNGSGTEQDPYVISSLDNLYWLSINNSEWDKYFTQSLDIDATNTNNWNVGDHDLDPNTPDEPMGFLPIGDDPVDGKRQIVPFTGLYNGNGHVIMGLCINMPGHDNIGMFGMIQNGSIVSNLKLNVVNIKGKNKTGGIVGYCRDNNTQISQCNTTGSIQGNWMVGGLAGYNLYGTIIDHCYSTATVTGNSECIGGLVGYNYGCTIKYCNATGVVNGHKYVGGLVGYNNELSTIEHCYASGAIAATNIYCGGLVGRNYNSTITHCHAIGNVNGGENTGGLVGEVRYNSTIDNSHAKGNVYGTGKSVGGFIGGISNSNPISHCYATGDVSGTKWYFGGLTGQCNNTNIENSYATGNINPESDNRAYCGGLSGRVQLGYIYKCFASGNVNNQSLNTNDMDKVGGLIGEANNGSVVDLSCAKGNVYGCYEIGGLVGKLVDDSRIQNSYARGETKGIESVAGLVGYFEGGTIIKYCYATGKITATSSGGTYSGIVATTYGHVEHSYYDKETTEIFNNYQNFGFPKTTAEMKTQSTYTGWEFGDYWAIDTDINDGYPYLIGTPQQITGQIIWEGTDNSNWSNPDNWNFGFVPNTDDNVLIPDTDNDPVISATDQITINNLTVEDNAILILESTAENTASLIVSSQASGNVQMECFLTSNNYHFIHIPVNTGQTNMKDIKTTDGDSYLGLTPDDDDDLFEKWNEDNDTDSLWTDLLHGTPPLMDNATFEMNFGYGYFNTDNKESGNGTTLVFEGSIQTGDISFYKTYTEEGAEGYHVIGNPFTSTISINNFAGYYNNFLNDNANILHDNYEAVYLWKADDLTNDASGDYEVICNCGFTGVGDTSEFGYDFIAPCQGFIVRIEHEGNLVFKNSIRKHGNTEFYKSLEKSWPGILLSAESELAKTSTKIGFHKNMTEWMEPSFDVATMKGNAGANLYTRIRNEDEHFAVQSLPAFTDSIVCGIDITSPGEYTFSIYQKEINYVNFKDKETGEVTDMLYSTYSVFLPEGNYENRFVLYLSVSQNTGLNGHYISEDKIYSYKKTIYLDGISGMVNIYDISGCQIKSIEANGSSKSIPMNMFTDGIYIVKTANSSKKLLLRY